METCVEIELPKYATFFMEFEECIATWWLHEICISFLLTTITAEPVKFGIEIDYKHT